MQLQLTKKDIEKFKTPQKVLESPIKKSYTRGDIIYNRGDKTKFLGQINSGIVGLVNLSSGGHEALLRVFGKHDFLGYRSFLVEENFHATAIALSDVSMMMYPYSSGREIFDHDPELYYYLSRVLAFDLRQAEERINDITGKRVGARVIETLIYLKTRHPDHLWTRREIGEFCGAKTETVTRALSKAEKEGLIVKDGREILIPDMQKLLDYSEQLDFI